MDFEAYYKQLQGQTNEGSPKTKTDDFESFYNSVKSGEPAIPTMQEKISQGKLPSMNLMDSPLIQDAQATANQIIYDEPAGPPNPNLPGRRLPVIGPVLRGADWLASNPVSQAIAEYTVPDQPMIRDGEVTGTNARDRFLRQSGKEPATGASKFIGQAVAPFFVPGSGLGAGTNLRSAAETLTSRLSPGLGRTAAREAAIGAPIGFGSEYAQGEADPVQAVISGGIGAAGGAALPLVGAGIRAASSAAGRGLTQAVDRPSLGTAVDDFTKRMNAESPSAKVSEGPSYSGVNLLSRTDRSLPTPEPAPTMEGNWFTNLFGNRGLGVSAFNDSKRISKGPLSTEDQLVKSGLRNDVQGLKDSAAAQARAAYQNFVDRLDPLKKISLKSYETAMDSARANNIANTIVRDKFVTPEGTVVGEGLSNVFKKVARGQDKQFIDYLTLRHAKTRLERDERVYAKNLGMTPERVQERLNMYDQRHPGFSAIAQEWDQFNDNVLQNYGVKEGLISEDVYKALREKNPNYSPMRREFLRSEKPGRNFLSKTTSSSFSGQKAPIREVSPTGSVRNIVDPRKTTIENVGAWANAAMRNRVMQSMVDTISRNPEAFKGVAEIVQKPKNATDLRKVLLDSGEDDFVESLNADFKNLFKTTRVDGDNIVRAMVNGEPIYLQVHDPEIVKTLIGMGPQTSNLIMDTLSALSNATKRGATGMLAPVFAVKGATTDLVQSAIQAKNPLEQAGYTIYSIFSGIGDRLRIPGLRNLAEEYRRAGGEYSAALKGDMGLNRSISNMTRDPLLSPKGIGKGALRAAATPFKILEAVGNIAENAPRMAAYKSELRRLGGERTPDNIRQAMSQARESTVNFSRRGAMSRDIESLIPYNNAAVQGTYRVMKAFKDNKIKTTAAIASLAVLPKLYEYMQFADDPDYQKLPARERSRFLIVNKNDDGSFTKIPMEPAYNSIGEMTIEALRYFKDNDPQAFKESADALANAWLPPAVTGALQGLTQGGGVDQSIKGAINATVGAPFVAVSGNQSFTGAPIEPMAVQDRSPQYRYDERTSAVAKKIGDITGYSPMKIDYLLRAYGGDPARLLLPLSSQVGAGNTRNTLLKNFIVDPQFTNNLTNDFYGGKEKLTQAYRDNKEMEVPMPPWFSEDLYKDVSSQAKGSISKKLSNLTAEKKAINADERLTSEQKANNLRQIQSQMNDIYMDINSKMYQQGIPRK